ncbi:TPA: conjugal transfer protein TraG [Legionella pneumophila]|nr:conjugal transfer protein TraG [Legionella pneumophila]HAV1167415.1 conjugal transfer protein TraG [Legionella pneumophila]
MSPLLIYTPQNGIYLKELLDGVATLLTESTFSTACDIIMILSVGMVGYQYVMGKKLESLTRFMLTTFLVMYCVLGIKVPVAIIDMQTAEGAGEALTVDHVPLGVALPASLISGMGYGITTAFSDVFRMPDSLEYNKTGMIFGARTWLAATQTRLSMSPDLAQDLSSYIRQCVFTAKLLASHQLSPQELTQSAHLSKTYFEEPSPIYRVILHNGVNLSCGDAAANLKTRLPIAAKLELERLNHLVTTGVLTSRNTDSSSLPGEKTFGDRLQAAHKYYMNITEDAAETLTQNILINATRDAAADAFAFSGADAALMNYTNTDSTQKMHIAEANSFWLAGFRLPYYMTVMWMLTLCIFPLVVLISFFPTLSNAYFLWVQSQIYLWSWPPMFIIFHWFVSMASSTTITLFGQKTGGVTFSNIDSLASMHSNFAYTAGALAASVPVIALYITKGLGQILSTSSQHFGGMAQSLSVSEAQSAAAGNISMASYSGWNMNYENTSANNVSANKHDTNWTNMHGMHTEQLGSGVLKTTTSHGDAVYDVNPGMSRGPVHISDTKALSGSLNQAFEESRQAAANESQHYQTSLSSFAHSAVQLSKMQGHDMRLGDGVSTSESGQYSQALSTMTHIASDVAKREGISQEDALAHMTAAGLNVHAGVASEKSMLGSIGRFAFGATGGADSHAKFDRSSTSSDRYHEGTDSSMSAKEAEDFNQALNYVSQFAQNHHFDNSHSEGASLSNQMGTDLREAQTASQNYDASMSKAARISTARSYVESNADQVTTDLNQAFSKYVASRTDEATRDALYSNPSDLASLKQLQTLANEFIHEQREGLIARYGNASKNARIDSFYQDAANPLSTKESQMRADYHKNSNALEDSGRTMGVGMDASRAKSMQQKINNQVDAAVNKTSSGGGRLKSQYQQAVETTNNDVGEGKKLGQTNVAIPAYFTKWVDHHDKSAPKKELIHE